MKEFDDQDAVRYIMANVPSETAARYDEDAIQYFIDTLFDCYDDLGMLDIDIDGDDDTQTEIQAVIQALTKTLRGDRNYSFDPADIPLLVKAENDYEDSLL